MSFEGLTCSICFERFDDKNLCPRLLSCGHSFCSGCLEKLLHSNTINCPTCRNAVSVTAGVAGLPKNFALLDIVNAAPQHAEDEGSHFCEACDGEQHPATSCCLDCKEDMCKTAAGFHTRSKASRDHRIVSLEKLKANPKLAPVSIFCPEHNDQLRFFDEDCGHVVCRDCVALEHSGHKCVSLDKAASKYQQEMAALVTKADTHIEEIKAAEVRVTNVCLKLKETSKEKAAKIQDMFKEFHAALTTREQVLINELNQFHKTKAVILTEQQDRLRIFQACIQSVVQRAKSAIQSTGSAEFLVAMSDIDATLRAIESQSPVLEPEAECMLEVSFNTFEGRHLMDVLNNAGVVSDKSTCAETTTATGLGLKQAIAGWKASFTVTAHDARGDLRGLGGDVFMAELKDASGEMQVAVNFKDEGDGTYSGTYTVPRDVERANYTLSVRLRGAHIQNSPFVVSVGNLLTFN